MISSEAEYLMNNENKSGSFINNDSRTDRLKVRNDLLGLETLDKVENQHKFELNPSLDAQKESSVNNLLENSVYIKNRLEIEKPGTANFKPEPSSISSISKEMRRLCSILTLLFDFKQENSAELTEEQYRWHWMNILKCTSIEGFSPYQVIFAPCETCDFDSKTIENVICDLNAYYKFKLHDMENKVLRGVSKRGGCRKKNDIVTSVNIDKVSINTSEDMKQGEFNKTKDEIYNKNSKKPAHDCSSKHQLSKPGRKSASRESAARILQMCLASAISETGRVQCNDEKNIEDISGVNFVENKLSDQCDNKEVSCEGFQVDNESLGKTNSDGQNIMVGDEIDVSGQISPIDNEAIESLDSSIQDSSLSTSIGKQISSGIISKVRKKVPRCLYVKWSCERTHVGGSFVITKGKGYIHRFPPKNLSVSDFQNAFKDAIQKRIELYGPIAMLPSSCSLKEEDFKLDEELNDEIEKKIELYNLSRNTREYNEATKDMKRKCFNDNKDGQVSDDISLQPKNS